jgi:hypothetical protein
MNLARPTTPLRWPLLAAAAAFAAIALPATARATDYCVAPNTTCGGTNVSTFEQALDLADNANDADRIFLGDATYTAPTTSGFDYFRPAGPLEIAGDASGHSVLTAPDGSTVEVLGLSGAPGSSVHDLTVHIPQNVGASFGALRTTNLAQRVLVDEEPVQTNQFDGVELRGGTLEDSTVLLSQAETNTGVFIGDAAASVISSHVTAKAGLKAQAPATLDRSSISAAGSAVTAFSGTLVVKSSLLRVSASNGNGLVTITQLGTHPSIQGDGVTIVGPDVSTGSGVSASTVVFPNESTDVTLSNSIIRGFGHALRVSAPGTGTATLTASFSDYDPSANLTTGANASLVETDVTNLGDAHFADAAAGDFHLLPGSPLVDAGDPAVATGEDLDGNLLVADGDGDGIARRDMGAFELPAGSTPPSGGSQGEPAGGQTGGTPSAGGSPQPTPATRRPDTQPPLITAFRRHGRRFSFVLSEPARVKLVVLRAKKGRFGRFAALSDGAAQGGDSIGLSRRRVLRPGLYRASIVAIDAAGNRSAAKRIKFRVR